LHVNYWNNDFQVSESIMMCTALYRKNWTFSNLTTENTGYKWMDFFITVSLLREKKETNLNGNFTLAYLKFPSDYKTMFFQILFFSMIDSVCRKTILSFFLSFFLSLMGQLFLSLSDSAACCWQILDRPSRFSLFWPCMQLFDD